MLKNEQQLKLQTTFLGPIFSEAFLREAIFHRAVFHGSFFQWDFFKYPSSETSEIGENLNMFFNFIIKSIIWVQYFFDVVGNQT